MNDSTTPNHEVKKSGSVIASRVAAGRLFALWLVAGLVLGGIVSVMVIRWQYGDSTPTLHPTSYYAARDKWKANAAKNYDIEVKVTGTQGATYRVQVRNGEAVAAWRNDGPLLQQRTFGTWSVPGMFGTVSRDIEVLEKHAAGRADQFTPQLTLRAEFDPQYGYPARYRRIQWGSPVEVSWEVTKFAVLPDKP